MSNGHARLSPSSSNRWIPCPGSVNLIASLPAEAQDQPNEHSLRGTFAHDVLRMCLENRAYIPAQWLGTTIPDTNRTFDLEDANAVKVALDYVFKRIAEIQNGMMDVRVFVEHRVAPGKRFHACPIDPEAWPLTKPPEGEDAPFVVPREDCTGQADVIIIGGGVLETIDYKHGVTYVDEVENTQTLLYTLGALREVVKMGDAQVLRTTIIQPRCFRDDVEPVRSWDLTDEEMVRWAVRFNNAAVATDAEVPVFNPGPVQCKYCPAKAVCPALTEKVEDLASTLAKGPPGLPTPIRPQPGAPSAPTQDGVLEGLLMPVEQLDDAKLAAIMDNKSLVIAWIEAVSAHCTKLAKDGHPVWGKLVAGRGSKKYNIPEDKLIKRLANTNRAGSKAKVRKEEYTTSTVISPAQMEKRIKPLVSETTWKNLAKLITYTPGGPTLVSLSDTRKPIQPSAEEMFPTQTEDTVSQEDFLS